jgi:hypothetical protein
VNVSTEAEDIGEVTVDKGLHTYCSKLQSVVVIMLSLLVVTVSKCLINPITNPYPVCNHSHKRQYKWLISSTWFVATPVLLV